MHLKKYFPFVIPAYDHHNYLLFTMHKATVFTFFSLRAAQFGFMRSVYAV